MAKPYQIVANLLALFAIVYVGVDIFYRTVRMELVPPVAHTAAVSGPVTVSRERVEESSHNYGIITQRNIFGVKAVEEEAPTDEVPDLEVLAPTTLKLTLLGTIAGGGKGNGRAIIQDDNNRKQNIYREGDAVQDAVIKNILREKVILTVNGRNEVLTMQEIDDTSGSPPHAAPDNQATRTSLQNITLEQTEIEAMMGNLGELLTQVRIRPYFRAGKTEGLIISRIGRNSVFAKLGLQNGDIIKTVDNRVIRSPEDAMALYENLKSGGRMTMKMIRRGKEQEINYDIR